MLRSIFCFFSLICAPAFILSQQTPVYMSSEDSDVTRKRLSTGSLCNIEKVYDEFGLLSSIRYVQEYPLVYERHFYPNGKLYKDGLKNNYDHIGFWKYYRKDGSVYKKVNYNTFTRKLYGIEAEKFDSYFQSARKKADQVIIDMVGQSEFDKHIRLSRDSWWHVYNDGSIYFTQYDWFDTPFDTAQIAIYFRYLYVLDDSTYFHVGSISVDTNMVVDCEYFDTLPDCKNFPEFCSFSIDRFEAIRIAEGFGFPAEARLTLYNGQFCWQSNRILKDEPGDWEWHPIYINCLTGAIDSSIIESAWQSHTGGPYPYTKAFVEDRIIKSTQKKVPISYLTMVVPRTWMHIYEDHYTQGDRWYFAKGDDTLFYYTHAEDRFNVDQIQDIADPIAYDIEYQEHFILPNPPVLRITFEDASEENKREVQHYNDSVTQVYNRQVSEIEKQKRRESEIQDSIAHAAYLERVRWQRLDSLSATFENEYLNYTDSGYVQTRKVIINIGANDDETFFVRLTLRDLSNMWMTDWVDIIFYMNGIKPSSMPEILSMLGSLRFKYE